jgi:hypothetical protein
VSASVVRRDTVQEMNRRRAFLFAEFLPGA